jgi:hypothetical protein
VLSFPLPFPPTLLPTCANIPFFSCRLLQGLFRGVAKTASKIADALVKKKEVDTFELEAYEPESEPEPDTKVSLGGVAKTAGTLAGAFLKRGDDGAFREPEPEPKVSLEYVAKTAGRSPVLS